MPGGRAGRPEAARFGEEWASLLGGKKVKTKPWVWCLVWRRLGIRDFVVVY